VTLAQHIDSVAGIDYIARMPVKKKSSSSRIEIKDLDMMSATNAKNRFGDLLHRVCYEKKHVLIEKSGRPMAVVMDVEQYLDLKRAARRNQALKTPVEK
jgi:prevent-host-death family protein